MSQKSLNIAKIKAYDDIKRMVRFLQEEQASLDKNVNKREFFRKNLETIYDTNFKKKLPIEEFESIIFDICVAKTLIMGDINEANLYRKIEDTIMQYNIRSKNLIAEKISMAVADDPRMRTKIKALAENKYKDIVTPIVADMIRVLIPDKEIDSREIIARVQEDRYDLDTVSISKIFSKELKLYQEKHKDAFKRDLELKRRMGKGDDIKRDSRAPGGKTPVEKMTMIVERENKRKEEFIKAVEDVEFKLGETFLDDNTRVFVHEATYKQKRLVIISYALEGEIDNVSLLFENVSGSKQGEEFFFDLGELQAIDEKVKPSFIKSKLGLFSRMLGVSRTLEAIWFLAVVLSVDRKLPIKTVEFVQDSFLAFLEEIETDIHKRTVQDALQK
ncbi:hypothetical protein ACFL6I_08375 [candidate division KSB1 bacterium]